jgi:hypothetical protein
VGDPRLGVRRLASRKIRGPSASLGMTQEEALNDTKSRRDDEVLSKPGNLTPNPFPSGKGNRIVGSNLFRAEGEPDLFECEQKGVLAILRLVTGCRGHPCRRKRETHRGFHIHLPPFDSFGRSRYEAEFRI